MWSTATIATIMVAVAFHREVTTKAACFFAMLTRINARMVAVASGAVVPSVIVLGVNAMASFDQLNGATHKLQIVKAPVEARGVPMVEVQSPQ